MANEFVGSAVVDKPIDEVFAFLEDGTNDLKFSPRVLEIRKTTDGPVGVGTVFESKVKDAGMKTNRKFELTEFEAPTKIRWSSFMCFQLYAGGRRIKSKWCCVLGS